MILLFSEMHCVDSVILIKYGKMDSSLNSLVETKEPKSPNTHYLTVKANYNGVAHSAGEK